MNTEHDLRLEIDKLSKEVLQLRQYLGYPDNSSTTLIQELERHYEQKHHDVEYLMWKMSSEQSAALAIHEFVNARPFFTKNDRDRHDFGGRQLLLQHAISRSKPEGLFMEFGVYAGESINYLASLVPNTIYGFDSFQGLPTEWFLGRPKGHLSMKGEKPRVNKNVMLIEGWFNETIPAFLTDHCEDISFMHLDCDVYISTKHVLESAIDRIVPGTIMVFDEFCNYPGWQVNEYRAFKEFVDTYAIHYRYIGFTPRHYSVAIEITSKQGAF